MRRAVPKNQSNQNGQQPNLHTDQQPKMVVVHVPMMYDVREKLALRAYRLGFDSVQAYIRFWALAEAEERHLDLGDGSIPIQIKHFQHTGKYRHTYTDADILAELGGPDFSEEAKACRQA